MRFLCCGASVAISKTPPRKVLWERLGKYDKSRKLAPDFLTFHIILGQVYENVRGQPIQVIKQFTVLGCLS